MECGVGRCWQSRVCLKSAVTGCSPQLWATESFDQRDFIYYPKGNKTRKRNLLSIGTSLRLSRTQLLNVLVVSFLSSPSCPRSSKSWLAEERWATRRYESGKKYLFCFKKSSVFAKINFYGVKLHLFPEKSFVRCFLINASSLAINDFFQTMYLVLFFKNRPCNTQGSFGTTPSLAILFSMSFF